jgi:hypothetical protein
MRELVISRRQAAEAFVMRLMSALQSDRRHHGSPSRNQTSDGDGKTGESVGPRLQRRTAGLPPVFRRIWSEREAERSQDAPQPVCGSGVAWLNGFESELRRHIVFTPSTGEFRDFEERFRFRFTPARVKARRVFHAVRSQTMTSE